MKKNIMQIKKLRLIRLSVLYSIMFSATIPLIFYGFTTWKYSHYYNYIVSIVLCLILMFLTWYPFFLLINYYIADKGKRFHVNKEKQIIQYTAKGMTSEIDISEIKRVYMFRYPSHRILRSYCVIHFNNNHPPILLTNLIVQADKLEKELGVEIKVIWKRFLFITKESYRLPLS